MMKHNAINVIGVLLLQISISSFCTGQGLKVGDVLPVTKFENVLNVAGNSLDLGKTRSILTILEFWETNCSGCFKGFSKIDSLQGKFRGEVQFIMVNQRSMDSTERFFQKRSKLKKPDVPFVTADIELNILFPHNGVPYCVWLDSNLSVIGFSNPGHINEITIRESLVGKKVVPTHVFSARDRIEPLVNYNYADKIDYYSFITRCIQGYPISMPDSLRKRSAIINLRCNSVSDLYRHAFSNGINNGYGKLKVLIKSRDSANLVWPVVPGSELNNNIYNYTLLIPRSMESRSYAIMRADLDRFFGYKAAVQKIVQKCLVLELTCNPEKIYTNGGEFKNTFSRSSVFGDVKDSIREIRNGNFILLVNAFYEWFNEFNIPFINNNGIKLDQNIDIKLSASAVESLDINLINQELIPYGLRLSKKDFGLDVLVISDP